MSAQGLRPESGDPWPPLHVNSKALAAVASVVGSRWARCSRLSGADGVRWSNRETLHHPNVFVGEDVTVHHKAPDSIRIKVRPKRHGPERRLVNILGIIARLGLGRGQNQRVMPLRHGETLSVHVREQKRILMDVEDVIREGTVDHRPLLEVPNDHIVKQRLILVK